MRELDALPLQMINGQGDFRQTRHDAESGRRAAPSDREICNTSIVGGLTVDTVGTIAAVLLVLSGITFWGAFSGVPESQIHSYVEDVLLSPAWLLIGGIIGTGFTVLGAYLAARWAGRDERLHSLAVGVGSLLISGLLAMGAQEPDPTPVWYQTLAYGILLPGALWGGYLARCRRFRQSRRN